MLLLLLSFEGYVCSKVTSSIPFACSRPVRSPARQPCRAGRPCEEFIFSFLSSSYLWNCKPVVCRSSESGEEGKIYTTADVFHNDLEAPRARSLPGAAADCSVRALAELTSLSGQSEPFHIFGRRGTTAHIGVRVTLTVGMYLLVAGAGLPAWATRACSKTDGSSCCYHLFSHLLS